LQVTRYFILETTVDGNLAIKNATLLGLELTIPRLQARRSNDGAETKTWRKQHDLKEILQWEVTC